MRCSVRAEIMKPCVTRVARLENRLTPQLQPDFASNPRGHLRLVVSTMSALNLATSTCVRRLTAKGFLTEVVRLDGFRGNLTDEELERFVESFPIERS
jgi:hypothetical protein